MQEKSLIVGGRGVKRNTNFMKVKVKLDRHCCNCGSTISKGTECITMNSYAKGRRWLCMKCHSLAKTITELNNICTCIPFDDEGSSYYFDGKLEDAKVEFEYRRKMK